MPQKALMLASVASMIDQFNIPNIKLLQSLGYSVDVVADFTNPGTITAERAKDLIQRLSAMNVRVIDISIPRSLNPLAIISAYVRVRKLITTGNYALIHCHSPIGGFICRIAARKERKKGTRVIYTAHGFHFYNGAPIKNWLLFYPVEWVCSWWTDVLITINKEDYERAKKHFHAKKTVYVPGVGIDTKKFAPVPNNREKIRKMLGVNDDQNMLLSVGELNVNKNHEAVIKAIQEIEKIVYVIVGKGELEEHLKAIKGQADVRVVGFRDDVADFYDAADVYVLPSIREGLNVSLMEAMASGLAIACSDIRGNTDLITNPNCLFNPTNTEDIKVAIEYVIKHKIELGAKNLERIRLFDLSSVEDHISATYTPPQQYRHLVMLVKWQMKRKEIGVPLRAKMLLSVGELSKRKNHRIVVEALQQLPEDYWYIIVGQGELKEELKRLDKTGRLKLLGYRTDIVELLRCSDLFVFPSLQEGLPVALMEAMSCGVPCVASRIRGNVDLVKDNLFSPKNLEELIGAIEEKHAITSLSTCFSISNIEQTGNNLYKNVSNACFEQ